MIMRSTVATAICVATIATIAGCATHAGRDQSQSPPASGGSATPAAIGMPTTSGQPAAVTSGCAHPTQLRVSPTQAGGPVCLPVGHQLRIDTPTSPHQPWQAFVSSDPGVIECTSTTGPDGAATATCRALRTGSATISTATAPFTGDPHGPPQMTWTLTVHVTP